MKSTRLVQLREKDSREMSHRTDDGLVVTVICHSQRAHGKFSYRFSGGLTMDWVDNRFTARALRPRTCFTIRRLVSDQDPRLTDVVSTVRTGAQYGIVYRHGVPVGQPLTIQIQLQA